MLPRPCAKLLDSYIYNKQFKATLKGLYTELNPIESGVLQGSVLDPIFYLLYTCNISQIQNWTINAFADDTTILATWSNIEEVSIKLQDTIDMVYKWNNLTSTRRQDITIFLC